MVYIDALDHTATFHMANGDTLRQVKPLSRIEEELDSRFVRCHKSYIVNTEHIKSVYRGKRITVTGDDEIDIGRRYKSSFSDAYAAAAK